MSNGVQHMIKLVCVVFWRFDMKLDTTLSLVWLVSCLYADNNPLRDKPHIELA